MKSTFITLCYILSFLPGWSQFDYPIKEIEPTKYLVTYSLEYQYDSLNPEHSLQREMLLFIGEKHSKFTSKNYYTFDTITRKINSWEEFGNLVNNPSRPLPRSSIRYQIFKNYPQGKLTFIEHLIGGTMKFEEDLDLFNWELTGESDSLGDYIVYKAKTNFGGREWITWFTPDIPFSDGPYKFNGLPGLILLAHDTRDHYVFKFKRIEKLDYRLMIDYEEKDFIETTKTGFFKAKDSFRENIISRAKDAGASAKSQQIAAKNISKKNNPIELKRK